MAGIFRRIALRVAPGCDDSQNQEARTRVGLFEGWVSVTANVLLAAIKGVLAVISGSVSLMADAIHTLSDSLTSVVVIVGFRLARKPADLEHPFGHARIESIASLVIGVLLLVAALELGRAGAERLVEPSAVVAPIWMIVVVALTALAKEVMARFSMELGRLIGSGALEADGWHHRSDVFATGLVVVAFIAARFGVLWLDGVAGVGVALILGWAAFTIIKEAAQPLIGERASDEEIARITELAEAVRGVRSAHDIVFQKFGYQKVVALHVVVPAEMSAVEAHAVCERVERAMREGLSAFATVHADPQPAPHPAVAAIRTLVLAEIEATPGCSGVHDLRAFERDDQRLVVTFDVTTAEYVPEADQEDCRARVERRVAERYAGARVEMKFDPPFCLGAS